MKRKKSLMGWMLPCHWGIFRNRKETGRPFQEIKFPLKRYCRDCRYSEIFYGPYGGSYGGGWERCEAEENRKYWDEWDRRHYKLIRHPKRINKFNDCRWYLAKE